MSTTTRRPLLHTWRATGRPYQQSKSTTPLYYSWNLGGERLLYVSGQHNS